MKQIKDSVLFALLRISLGFVFLWAYLDKLFGLSIPTEASKSWFAGVSPTQGFLQFATKGPMADIYQSLAGQAWVDVLFMSGLMLLGVCLVLGIALRIAGKLGAVFMLLLWAAALPPEHNPVVDEHIVYLFVLLILPLVHAGDTWGYGKEWSKSKFVKLLPFLK